MRCNIGKISLALTTLVALTLARPGLAQQAPKDVISFKAVLTGAPDNFIPSFPGVYPPQGLVSLTLKGNSPTLGALTYQDTHVGFWRLDGTPGRVPEGKGTLVLANGDRLYINWTGVTFPGDTPGTFRVMAQATIIGGTGQFAGVLGDVAFTIVVDGTKTPSQVTETWEGTFARPKQ